MILMIYSACNIAMHTTYIIITKNTYNESYKMEKLHSINKFADTFNRK